MSIKKTLQFKFLQSRFMPPKAVLFFGVALTIASSYLKEVDGAWFYKEANIVVSPLIGARFNSDAKVFRDAIQKSLLDAGEILNQVNVESTSWSAQKTYLEIPYLSVDYNGTDDLVNLDVINIKPKIYLDTKDSAVRLRMQNFTDSYSIISNNFGKVSGTQFVANVKQVNFFDEDVLRLKRFYQKNSVEHAFSETYLDRIHIKIVDLPVVNYLGELFKAIQAYNMFLSNYNFFASPLSKQDLQTIISNSNLLFKKTSQVVSRAGSKVHLAYALFMSGNAELLSAFNESTVNQASLYTARESYKRSLKILKQDKLNKDLRLAVYTNLASINMVIGYLDFDKKAVKDSGSFFKQILKRVEKKSTIYNVTKHNLKMLQ